MHEFVSIENLTTILSSTIKGISNPLLSQSADFL